MSKANRVKTFSVGDRVSWESQASGTWKKKIGTVVEVVPAHTSWSENRTGVVGTRGHESYIVEVDTVKGGKRQRQTRYWPIVKNLHLVKRGKPSAQKAATTGVVSKETGLPPVPRPLDPTSTEERDPEAEYAADEERRATAGLEQFCDPDALGAEADVSHVESTN